MPFKYLLITIGLLLGQKAISADLIQVNYFLMDSIEISELIKISSQGKSLNLETKRPNPILISFRKKRDKDKKIVAAVLAFPFPFGIVGLHRIYLGCAPYIPVVYIASLGGVLGILPFIDCCVLLLDKNLDRYIDSKKVFMWVQ